MPVSTLVRWTSLARWIACFLFAAPCAARAADAAGNGSSPSVRVEAQGRVYTISRAYRPGVGTAGGSASIHLGMLLPDFEPEADDEASFKLTHWDRQLALDLVVGRSTDPDVDWVALFRHTHGAGVVEQREGACTVYSSPLRSWFDLHVCDPGDGRSRPVAATCDHAGRVPYPSCHVTEKTDEVETVTYYFPATFVGDLPRIDARVRAILLGFRSG